MLHRSHMRYLSRCAGNGCQSAERAVTSNKDACNTSYYEDAEVARLLGISVGRLRNKICAGEPLPPRIQPKGSRQRLWPRQAVHRWLDQFTEQVADDRRMGFLPRS